MGKNKVVDSLIEALEGINEILENADYLGDEQKQMFCAELSNLIFSIVNEKIRRKEN